MPRFGFILLTTFASAIAACAVPDLTLRDTGSDTTVPSDARDAMLSDARDGSTDADGATGMDVVASDGVDVAAADVQSMRDDGVDVAAADVQSMRDDGVDVRMMVDTGVDIGVDVPCSCTARPHMTATCSAGACSYACVASYADCNSVAGDGCEVNTTSSVTHCGSCSTVCPSGANATAACTASSCRITCNAGFADCDGNPANGCEANLATSTAHCGACNAACSGANGTATCTAGTCAIACNGGFGNCDGNAANGCESELTLDDMNCGVCGRVCTAIQICCDGTCLRPAFCNPI